jgi:hypothetical protein
MLPTSLQQLELGEINSVQRLVGLTALRSLAAYASHVPELRLQRVARSLTQLTRVRMYTLLINSREQSTMTAVLSVVLIRNSKAGVATCNACKRWQAGGHVACAAACCAVQWLLLC